LSAPTIATGHIGHYGAMAASRAKRATPPPTEPGDPGEPSNPPTLAAVLDEVGSIVAIAAAPSGLDVAVARPVIHDPLAAPAIEPGDLVLAVGTPPSGHGALDVITVAGAHRAAAVVLRTEGELPTAVQRAAADADVAVLTIGPSLTWSQLHTLLRTVVATSTAATAATTPDAGPTGQVGDLFRLANAIAAMVGGPTTIEDRESTVLAYSSHDTVVDEHRRQTILGHRVPEAWRRRLQDDGVFRRLWNEPGAVRLEYPDADPPLRPRIAIAVRAGEEILGSIWVAEGDRPLGSDAELALAEAAPIAALHLIRWRSSEDLDRARRSALLRSVLEGSTPAAVLADALDVDRDAFVTVLAFRLSLDQPEDAALRAGRARDLIALYCESFRRKAASVAVGGVVYVLVPDAGEPDRARLVVLAEDIVERIRGPLRTEVVAAIGSTRRGLDHVARSRREADAVLRVLGATAPTDDAGPAVGTIEAHRPATILGALRDHVRDDDSLLEGPLRELVEHDAEHRTSYVETLRAYLDAFGDVVAAAASIGVHQNTFRYRLRRLCEIADLDLSDPTARLVLHLQLHVQP
jgi:DNA-binding PucR family transcriptional regulator